VVRFRLETVFVALVTSIAGCSLIDVDGLSRGPDGAGGGITGASGSTGTNASVGTNTSASATQGSTLEATTSGDTVSTSSTSGGCTPFCDGVIATHCFDFEGPDPTPGFVTNQVNGLGTLDLMPSPTDPACSHALVCDLTGFQDPNVPAYYQHGRAFDIAAIDHELSIAFKTYTEVAAPFTSIAVLNWNASTTRCQAVMMLGDDGSPYARFFLQSRIDDGAWSLDVEEVIRLDTTFVGRWLSYQLDIVSVGSLTFELTTDGKSASTVPLQHACATPTDSSVMLWLGPNYTTAQQTSYFDDLVVDVL
jgi:hypothetical protein